MNTLAETKLGMVEDFLKIPRLARLHMFSCLKPRVETGEASVSQQFKGMRQAYNKPVKIHIMLAFSEIV